MTTIRNATRQLKQSNAGTKAAFRRSPYREATVVCRVPVSIRSHIELLLQQCKQDVDDSKWLEKPRKKG